MKQISFWAACHPKTSWIVLAGLQLFTGALAFEWGVIQALEGRAIPPVFIQLGGVLCILSLTFYPVRRSASRLWKWSYGRQKLMDAGLVISSILMLTTWANKDAVRSDSGGNKEIAVFAALSRTPEPQQIHTFWQDVVVQGPVHAIKNVLHKQVKKRMQVNQQRDPDAPRSWWIVLLIILGCVLSVALGCVVICNGIEALGLLILFGGLILFIAGGVSLIKSRKAAYAKLKGPVMLPEQTE